MREDLLCSTWAPKTHSIRPAEAVRGSAMGKGVQAARDHSTTIHSVPPRDRRVYRKNESDDRDLPPYLCGLRPSKLGSPPTACRTRDQQPGRHFYGGQPLLSIPWIPCGAGPAPGRSQRG